MLNRKLSEFEIGDLIATGTAGRIHRAVENSTQREVALKILPPEVSTNRNMRLRFEREMLILSKLDHPNIVEYLGGGQDGKSLFYAMEKVDGGTLRQLIDKHGQLTWQETIHYGMRICSALQYLHNHGIVHRDVKPSNIFISYSGEIKLGDFGIAFDSGETHLTENGLVVGSYAYMAPEQIRGTEESDSRADLYSLGCVLFEMISGQPPFRGETFAQIFDQHLNAPVPDLKERVSDLPTSLENLIYRLLEKERHRRPFNARAAQGVLSELKYRWEEDEQLYRDELRRREQAFQAKPRIVEPKDVGWNRVGYLVGLAIAIIIAAIIVLNL